MTKTLNLPQEYFHCPELSKREQLYLVQKAQESAKALVESARSSHGPVRWIEAGAYKGVQIYKGEGRNPAVTSEHIEYVCGATSVQATIEEVASFMDVSTTAKFKAFVTHQRELLDGVVLYTLVPPAPENQYLHQVTIKWKAAHLSSKFIKNRDFLTLECQDVFTDTTGRRGWVRSFHSVKLPCCPDLQAELGLVRGSFYHTGYVFVESERRGWLDCIHTMQVNLKGNLRLPSSVYFLAMRRRIGTVAALGRTLQQRRLGKQTFLSDLELVPKKQRSRCHVCAAKFGVITRKSRCRKCGEVVCGQCTQTWEVSLPRVGVRKVRVCATCACVGGPRPMPNQVMEEISLLSNESLESDEEYNEHHLPLRLRTTMVDEQPAGGYDLYAPRRHGPQLASEVQHNRQSTYASHTPVHHGPATHSSRCGPLPHEQDPFRPIGFVHQSEYDLPRFDNPGPPRNGPPGYGGDYRDPYGREYSRDYGMHGPRHHSEYQRYPDDYRYYPPPSHGHGHGPPPPRYPSEAAPRPTIGKAHHTPTSEETTSSSDRSLTAHALERHTREMGRPGPVTPRAYDYEPPMVPPPQRHPYPGPPYPHEHPPHPAPPYRDSSYERESIHSTHSMHSMHSSPYHHYPRPSASDRPYPDDAAYPRSSVYSSQGRSSDLDTDYFSQLQSAQPQAPPRVSLVGPPVIPIHEQVVPENELAQTIPRVKGGTPVDPPEEPTPASQSPSQNQEAAIALAADAARLMQQQQDIQDQLYARAQSFTSDHRYSLSTLGDIEDDDEAEQGGVNGLEDWSTTSPSTRAMLNEFKSLDIDSSPPRLPIVLLQREPATTRMTSSELVSNTSPKEPEPEAKPNNTNPSTKLDGGEIAKLSVVQLYQKILELTKKQHALETDPVAPSTEKDTVAQDLQVLYKQLNQFTNENEVAF